MVVCVTVSPSLEQRPRQGVVGGYSRVLIRKSDLITTADEDEEDTSSSRPTPLHTLQMFLQYLVGLSSYLNRLSASKSWAAPSVVDKDSDLSRPVSRSCGYP